MELLINKDVWDKFSDGQRALIETVCQSNTAWSISVGATQQEQALKTIKDAGVSGSPLLPGDPRCIAQGHRGGDLRGKREQRDVPSCH